MQSVFKQTIKIINSVDSKNEGTVLKFNAAA